MHVQRIAFNQVPQFSSKDVAYATADPKLRPFYKYPVELASFAEVIEDKSKDRTDRKTLVSALKAQYEGMVTSNKVKKNIESLLSKKTFTIITAHQPALFTGPLYYILKIFSTINLVEQLNEEYPDYHFVPVFINGAEDHDFEEINHTYLHGKTIEWQNDEGGAVGKMSTKSLAMALNTLKDEMGHSPWAEECYQIFEQAYQENDTYGQAANQIVNSLFQEYGLVVAEMSSPALKRLFIPYMEKELFEQISSPLIQETQEQLEAVDFGQQAHARDINLFYLTENDRSRIVLEEDGTYRILDHDIHFTADSLKEELYHYPERFSPNVVMRPLYEEVIFPNLAYIGGGGELAYWLERKTQFEHFNINFPMLIRRNSAVWINHKQVKKIDKLGLDLQELFEDTEVLIKKFVSRQSENTLDLESEMEELALLIERYALKAKKVDPTLDPRARAIGQKYHNQLQKLQRRLMRAEKKKFREEIALIRWLKDDLFPNNGLQERKHNFLNFYLKDGPFFFKTLKAHLNPLEEGMVVFLDE
jgi:bacillithiol biosynthesis cysteine-adding enzyme BshC